MKIKIMYIMAGFPFAGGQQTFLGVARGLDTNKFEPIFVCDPGTVTQRLVCEAGISFMPINLSRLVNPRVIWQLIKIFKKIRPDIVHSQGARANFYVRIAAYIIRVPRLFATSQMTVENYNINAVKKWLYVSMNNFLSETVDRVVVGSNGVKELLIQKSHIQPEKISVIYNGIDPSLYKPDQYNAGAIKQKLGINKEMVVIGSVGRLVFQKAYHIFLQACAQVMEKNKRIIVLLIGEGDLRGDLEQCAVDLNIHERVMFLGFRENIPELLAVIDIFVISSILEGNPFTLLEAIAMGKPMVVTDINGIREVVQDNHTAYVVPPNNAEIMADRIRTLVNDPDAARVLGKQARSSNTYTVDNVVQQHQQLYETAL